MDPFLKSDKGAQSAWKGFSSQTLYIASRIASDTENNDFYPEDIEDLVVKKDGIIIEAIQVKNVTDNINDNSFFNEKRMPWLAALLIGMLSLIVNIIVA